MTDDTAARVHLIPLGEWRECTRGEACPLPFHLSNMSVAEAEALPASFLYPLMEAIDPPSTMASSWGEKRWYQPGSLRLHRDYGLPAIIYPDGHMEWWVNHVLHRDGGKPAIIHHDGRTEYWIQGHRVSE